MNVRVVAHVARPGLQHADQANLRAQKARIAGQLPQCAGRGAEEQVVEEALVAVGDITQLAGQCEGDQEVGHWQQQLLLASEPALGSVVLAGRAVAVAAGVVAVARGATGRAAVEVAAQGFGTALLNRAQGSLLAGQHLFAVLRAVGCTILTHNLAKRDHGRPAVKRSSAVAAVCSACWVRWVEIAVVVGEVWPIHSCSTRTLTPLSSNSVAQEWRSEWMVAGLLTPAACTALRKAFWSALSSI